MLAWSDTTCSVSRHIRPFIPARDLGDLAELIEVAFGDELARTGSRIAYDMRQLALWGPMLWVAQAVVPLFSGFVWIEGDKLVGNVSISRGDEAGSWKLSNVAVLPEYRGRGIAGNLVDVAIDDLRRRGEKRIFLQARSDHQRASSLYRHRGFTTFDTLHELNLARGQYPVLVGSALSSVRFRSVRASDWRNLYRLVIASRSREALHWRPVHARSFRRGFWWWWAQYWQVAMSGQECRELVGEEDGELVAYGVATTRLSRGPNELAITVRPSERGKWEMPLLEGLLVLMNRSPAHNVRAYVSASHPEALDAFRRLGFETLRVLDEMALELR